MIMRSLPSGGWIQYRMFIFGFICFILALLFELLSYHKQVAKTLRTKKSEHVSTSSYMCKIIKYFFALASLAVFANWVAFCMELAALAFCAAALIIIAQYKPDHWRLWQRKQTRPED